MPLLGHNIIAYVKSSNIYLAFKAVCHKSYRDLQLLYISTYQWKDFLIDFITGLSISINCKSETYDSILVIIDWVTKFVYYKPVKVTIDTSSLTKVILNVVVRYHIFLDSIMSDCRSIFNSKYSSLLCYFLQIKQKLSAIFQPQMSIQIKKQNNTIEVYLKAFMNFE